MTTMRILLAAALAVVTLPGRGAGVREEAAVESLSISVELERKARASDVEDLERLTAQVSRASEVASQRRVRLLELARETNPDYDDLASAEDSIVEAEARVRALEARRSLVFARLLERNRRLSALAEELARRRSTVRSEADPVTGRWNVSIEPGKQVGIFRLRLDGTLVSGDYVLAGKFRGSLRGTYVGDRITLQRIDSEMGFDATFYGKLNSPQKRISGSWEATAIAPATGPSSGTWGAIRLAEPETSGETP